MKGAKRSPRRAAKPRPEGEARKKEPARRAPEKERSAERTKQKLLEAGKRAFAAHGLHGATVQRIADDAGVNVSLISHHFGGKEALYRACLSQFSEMRLASLDRHLSPPKSVADLRARLEILIHELLELHLAEPEIVTILMRDASDPALLGRELEQQLFGFTTKLAQLFFDAKARGLLRSDADPMVASGMLYLAFAGLVHAASHIERMSGVTLRDVATRRTLVEKVLDILFEGVVAR